MRKATGLMLLGLAWGMAFPSCIFQTDPARPNSPPYIKESYPEDLVIDWLEAPVDSIMLTFSAEDPDRDEIKYSFVLVDREGVVLEYLHNGQEYVFKPAHGGFYQIQGRASDHSDFASRYWYISAFEIHNDPPVIDWRFPAQDSITTLIGNTLEFRMGVLDDHPDDLRYSYFADDLPIEISDPTSSCTHRFMENGHVKVTGLVWDGEYGDTLSWIVRVVGEPDTIPPARITDLIGWTGPDPGEIRIQWTAPGDDDLEGRVNHYEIRTHTIPILDEDDWDESSRKNNPPSPGIAGTTEEMVAENLNPGTWLFVTVRAVDDFGNMSELGNCIRLLVRGVDADGFITDASTGQPLPDIVVSSEGVVDTTGPDGYYKLVDLPVYTDMIRVRDEHLVGDPGDYYDVTIPVSGISWHFTKDLTMIPYYDLVSILGNSYEGSFYLFFRAMTDTRGLLGKPTVFKNWDHYPVTVYSPPLTYMDTDIKGMADDRMDLWNAMTGKDLFVITPDSASADVEIVYELGVTDAKHHVEYVSYKEDGTPEKMRVVIYPDNQSPAIQVSGLMVFAHELGHILQLRHSTDFGHLMIGGTMPVRDNPSTDEVNLVRTLAGLPAIFDAALYTEE